jgi:glycosyl transferase family 25
MQSSLLIIIIIMIVLIIIIALATRSKSSGEPQVQPIEPESFPFEIYVINLDRKPERLQYVQAQLKSLGLQPAIKWQATDGFKIDPQLMIKEGVTKKMVERLGIAGCATSHIRMWKHIAKNKMNWTLILEDDAHFHPEFKSMFHHYWNAIANDQKMSRDAKLIFPGYCHPPTDDENPISCEAVMCLHGYMISHVGAKYLLDNLLPMTEPVDIAIVEFFRHKSGSYIFNGSSKISGIRPDDYKEANGDKCKFDGIIYQNQEEQGSTIHTMETVF